jgi:hypothetical protein
MDREKSEKCGLLPKGEASVKGSPQVVTKFVGVSFNK